MEYSREQLKAACALNLCTVSVSQIIEYNDVQIMEQEYEAILNNLNLEQMPKDEALLNILKQLLDTITFFRIQEGDKQFIEREYQQKMKNAIWSAVPNIGMIVAGGNPVTMAISLASQVGIGYMNYRRAKSEASLERDKQRWQLERTAIEQFHGLRRELFDTAWRLAATYEFPDKLRLTEHQIRQYNNILMDNDLLRKYERLSAIKEHFLAYPPFWYNYGNTANAIAGDMDLNLPDSARTEFKKMARDHFMQFRASNEQGLLREDQISASCALELLDLLDIEKDRQLIEQLLEEAISFSGKANDVLQLASVAYLKLNQPAKATGLLRQLVNEQYNTVLNAQLLSSLYVAEYIKTQSVEAINAYALLQTRVGEQYLYPMPKSLDTSREQLEHAFVMAQRNILAEKYNLVLQKFVEKYVVSFGKIIPAADLRKKYEDTYYINAEKYPQRRKSDFKETFSKSRSAEQYKNILREVGFPYRVLELLNELFEDVCYFDFVTAPVRSQLIQDIEAAVRKNRNRLNDVQDNLDSNHFAYSEMCDLLDIGFNDFSEEFFAHLVQALKKYISSRIEMQDFAIAEQDLMEFCDNAGLPSPDILFDKNGRNADPIVDQSVKFGPELLIESSTVTDVNPINTSKMQEIIKNAISEIILDPSMVEFYTSEDARVDRYFSNNTKLKKDGQLRSLVLAILDDKSKKGDYDLIFTSMAVTPIKNGIVKAPIAYKDIKMTKAGVIVIDGGFSNDSVNIGKLYDLFLALEKIANPLPEKNVFPVKFPFVKK